MAKQKQKLELTWIGKDEEVKLEPRILIEDPAKSYGDPTSENMLIHGDNLLALKALEQDFAGKIKCIYIDPPYNTGSAFEHYDDNLEHSTWLNLMKPRLSLLKSLLSDDGVIFVQIDDNEQAYLKVLMDEIFGRANFVTNICVKMSHLSGVKMSHVEKKIPKIKEFILLYSKNKDFVKLNPVYSQTSWWDSLDRYNQFIQNINDHHSEWVVSPVRQAAIERGVDVGKEEQYEEFLITNAKSIFRTARNRALETNVGRNTFTEVLSARGLKKLVYNNEEVLFASEKLIDVDGRLVPANPIGDIWLDIGINNLHNEGDVDFRNGKKPEKLIERVISIATKPNDFVLDSFSGSGTTAAVAHKMGRRWIGIELGEHANTHCLPRLKAVIDGTDQGGISKSAAWRGGGGFKFYNLAPSLLKQDTHGNWVIDEKYNATMLAHAVCKHEGFRFEPHAEMYWKQGKSTETDFIFVTTNFVTVEQIDMIHGEMLPGESLLICAKSFAAECESKYPNITTKKIPKMILGKCEFGKENYDLNIIEKTQEVADEQSDNN